IRVWDLATGKELQPRSGHTAEVNAVAVSPDGQAIASGSHWDWDGTLRLWDAATGRLLRTVSANEGVAKAVGFVQFARGGRTLLVGGWVGHGAALQICDAATGKRLREFPMIDPKGGLAMSPRAGVLSPDGKIVAGAVEKVTDEARGFCLWAWEVDTG